MSARFAELKKVPKEPAVRLLAIANAKLKTALKAPANASVATVLAELEAHGAVVDMLRLLSAALPARERAWWSCLAARDVIGDRPKFVPAPLLCAEQWVFKPGDDTRAAAKAAVDAADADDDTTLCAMTVMYFDGTLGVGDLGQFAAPPGAAQTAAFGMNMIALSALNGVFHDNINLLIDRALDIARGGNGRAARAEGAPG